MSQALMKDPGSGLLFPREFIDQKQALKKVIDDLVDKCVRENRHIKTTYYLCLSMRFDKMNPNEFQISQPIASMRLPSFKSNTMVFWVSPEKGICELLWMVSAKKPGQKSLNVDFNKEGVAYLQAKGAMPS